MPAGKGRGHMLKMKMDIYHHRELREGEERRGGVARGNITAKKKKKQGCGERRVDEHSLGCREGEMEGSEKSR